jgi:hypothetical protein
MNTIKDDAPDHGGVEVVATWTVSAWDCTNVARWFGRGVPLGHIPSTIRDLMLAGFCLLFAIGCGAAELPSPEVSARAAELSALLTSTKTVETKQDTILAAIEANTVAISEAKTKVESLEASLVDSKSARKEDDQQSAPNPPAKANTALAPLKVATPGDFSRVASDGTRLRWNIEGNWNPTILETSAHLREHGIETHGMTHQEMADIHAAIHEGKPVAMRSKTVAYSSFVNRGTNCPNGQCPTSSTRYVRRSRR